MNSIPTPYEDLLRDVLATGARKDDRTGTGTLSVFGRQIRYNLADGFPLLTTKRVHFKSVAYELLWFLRGESNVRWLQDHGVTIWDEWADADGELGPVYGVQWRSWPTFVPEAAKNGPVSFPEGSSRQLATGKEINPDPVVELVETTQQPTELQLETIDQISEVISQIKTNPDSRRLIVSAWNVAQIPEMALPPCHLLFQFYVADGKLSCQLYQRSADLFLGVPFNIASYSLLTHMVAAQTGLEVGDFIWTGGDCHVYLNHLDQVREQLSREPRPYPRLELAPRHSIYDYTYDDIVVHDYDPWPTIKAPVAV